MEKRKIAGIVCTVFFVAAALGLAGFVGVPKIRQYRMKQQVLEALAIDDLMTRMQTLNHLRDADEATQYDAEIDEFDRIDKSTGGPGEPLPHWGKLDTILQQVRDIAAKG